MMITLVLTAAASSLLGNPAPGLLTIQEDHQLSAPDAAGSDRFGSVVSVDRDTIIVGAPDDDDLGFGSGAAYVFVRQGSGWALEQKLLPLDGAAFDNFARYLSLHGNLVVVSAPGDDDLGPGSGSAYVFERIGASWLQTSKLLASDGGPSDCLGCPVDTDNDTIVLGAPRADDAAPGNANADSGAAYLFEQVGSTWVESVKLVPSDTVPKERFGSAVSVSGDYVVCGAPAGGQPSGSNNPGSAYVFRRQGSAWAEEAKLVASDGADEDEFGASVDADGGWILVGSPCHSNPGEPTVFGTAYAFEWTGTSWVERGKLLPGSSGVVISRLGHDVALTSTGAVVSAPLTDYVGISSGMAFLFSRHGTSWADVGQLLSSDLASDDVFGADVSLHGDRAVIGATLADGIHPDEGRVYVFETGIPEAYCTGKTNSAGCVPFIQGEGVPSASSSAPFLVLGQGVVPGQAGVLLYGSSKANLSFHGGKLCVKTPFSRVLPPKLASSGGSNCTERIQRNFNKRIQSGADPQLTVGNVVRAQWLQRDPADPTGFFGDGLTNGLQFVIRP